MFKCRAAYILKIPNGKETNGWRGNIPRDVRALLPIAGRKRSGPDDDTVIILKLRALPLSHPTKKTEQNILITLSCSERGKTFDLFSLSTPLYRGHI